MSTMSSKSTFGAEVLGPRYSSEDAQKTSGATYTPQGFANFVSRQMLQVADLSALPRIRVLDPAVGDGALLDALIKSMPPEVLSRVEVCGFDTDPNAVRLASERLAKSFPTLKIRIEQKDFIELILPLLNDGGLFPKERMEPFDLVIANPPYVRTQILGASHAQELASKFGLTGRVDLYYPFLLGISLVLADGGVTGVITSNRFMTTKSGQAVRRALLSQFQVLHAWDLGDTKLFDAAVLPAVLLAKKSRFEQRADVSEIAFTSIYETKDKAQEAAVDPLSALDFSDDTVVALADGRRFRVRHGNLENGGEPEGLWRLATGASDTWLATVEANTWQAFRRIGKIRVGVKSTADKVFIRHDWADLPGGRPELLRNLITRHCARRFRAAIPSQAKYIKEILYPHEVVNGVRSVVDLNLYPKAKDYLEGNRHTLEARTYVIEAGRKWFELWVPQDPAAWPRPKLVFPDISDKPIFWIDTDGGVVNGECYWLSCEREDEEDLLWLALAVANSTFIEKFYDHKFNNKLYAGRRRFITQYVEQFPLPNPARKVTKDIIALVKRIHAATPSEEADLMASELDELVWQVFGLGEEITR